jgi:hypothetical protein
MITQEWLESSLDRQLWILPPEKIEPSKEVDKNKNFNKEVKRRRRGRMSSKRLRKFKQSHKNNKSS